MSQNCEMQVASGTESNGLNRIFANNENCGKKFIKSDFEQHVFTMFASDQGLPARTPKVRTIPPGALGLGTPYSFALFSTVPNHKWNHRTFCLFKSLFQKLHVLRPTLLHGEDLAVELRSFLINLMQAKGGQVDKLSLWF